MNCPNCNYSLAEGGISANCPHCGHQLTKVEQSGPGDELPLSGIKWRWFWIALIAPPLVTMVSAFLSRDISPMVGLFGGAGGGLFCGVMLAMKVTRTPGLRFGLSFLFAGVMVCVCVMLCYFGCSLGGFRLEIR